MSEYDLIIPMSGEGSRFKREGFRLPKPLIKVDRFPIIFHVLTMFAEVPPARVIFICSEAHRSRSDFNLEAVLARCCEVALPSVAFEIVWISPHKLGPTNAVLKAVDRLRDNIPVIVNYCDFNCLWDLPALISKLMSGDVAGVIPAYKGFHPHSLHGNNYAFCKVSGNRLSEIKEKEPFTDNRMEEYASSGTYCFSSAKIMRKYLQMQIDNDLSVNGEYYCSLAFNLMLRNNLAVEIFEINYFMQWGTPADFNEFQYYNQKFRDRMRLCQESPTKNSLGTAIVLASGAGSRFKTAEYSQPKPLLPVFGAPMVNSPLRLAEQFEECYLVERSDLQVGHEALRCCSGLAQRPEVVTLDGMTSGQAASAAAASEVLANRDNRTVTSEYLTFLPCDSDIFFSAKELSKLMQDSVDLIVWVTADLLHTDGNETQFGWVTRDQFGSIKSYIKKEVPSDDAGDKFVITGGFTFSSSEQFLSLVNQLVQEEIRVNGEFYLDSLVDLSVQTGLRVALLEVNYFSSLGTPIEYETHKYWASCFDKWRQHPYSLDLDPRLNL